MGKKWTPEQRQAASERAKAAIAAAKTESTEPVTETIETVTEAVAPAPATVTLTQEQFQMMLDKLSAREPVAPTGPSLGNNGQVIGVVERYPTNPNLYKNPIEELYDLPELKRFSVRENFVLKWSCSPTQYQTVAGVWYSEPRFELTLLRRQYDENGDELVKKDAQGKDYYPRIILGRVSFFEDPPANLIEAELAGVTPDDVNSSDFQDKMRMYRYKFWLIEKLMPKPPIGKSQRRSVEVIGGKAYEIDNSSVVI